MLEAEKSYLSKIINLSDFEGDTLSSNDVNEIIEKVKEYDFLVVSTDLNLTRQINKQKEEICSILLEKNEDIGTYFCSAKYCIVNNKLIPFNKKKCKKHEYILFCDDYIVKYIEKIENFRQDIYLERDVINTLVDKYDFVKKQAVVDFVDGEHFVNLVRKNIKGESCKDRFEAFNGEEACYNSIRQTFQQLHILEKEGFIYTDLKLDNILYDFNDNTYNLIDLGSVENIKDKDTINMNGMTYHRNHFLDLTTRAICSVYNVISHNDYINVTKAKGRERKDVVDVLRGDEFTKKFVERFVESGGCGGYGEFLEFFEEVVSGERNISNNGGDMSYTEEDTIFVQIASYRDPELQWTLKDLFEKAKRPENIFVGICHQYDMKDNEDKHLFEIPFSHPEQLRIDEVDYRDAKGLFFARSKTQKLYKNEKYTCQFDSHMRFYQNWDEIAVIQLKQYLNKNCKLPIITAYPPGYNPETNVIEHDNKSLMCIQKFHKDSGIIRLTGAHSTTNIVNNYINTSFISGNTFFTLSEHIKKIPYDVFMYFTDEENISVRSWTNGFDIFNINKNFVSHLWNTEELKNTRAKRVVISDDNGIGYHSNAKSNMREQHLFNMKKTKDPEVLQNIKEYGLGNKRTLRDYERFSGVDFRKKITKEHTKQGVFEEWQEVSKIVDVKKIFNNLSD